MNVDGMLHSLTPLQFEEWAAYYCQELDPLDRIAEILKRGFAAMRSTVEHHVDPNLFDPQHDKAREQQEATTPDQAAAIFGGVIQAAGGVIEHGNRNR